LTSKFTLEDAIAYLTAQGFALESEERSKSFGDYLGVFVGRGLKVHLIQDRSHKFIDVVSADQKPHFLSHLLEYMTDKSGEFLAEQENFPYFLGQLDLLAEQIRDVLANEQRLADFLAFEKGKRAQMRAKILGTPQPMK